MTNEVSEILKKMPDKGDFALAQQAFASGNKEAAKAFLDNHIYSILRKKLKSFLSFSYSSTASDVRFNYEKYYTIYGLEQPDWEMLLDKNKAYKYLIENNRNIIKPF